MAARLDELVVVDPAAMLALPAVAPASGSLHRVRSPRDDVRVAGNDYSAKPTVIGRIVAARADLGKVDVTAKKGPLDREG